MDYQSLMEEARAIQEEKTKKLSKMKEQRKQIYHPHWKLISLLYQIPHV